jgi:hypothetical protein
MAPEDRPDYMKLITIPAVITLGITLLRLFAEFGNLPPWLASKEAGGGGALLGISWLPPFFGVYFTRKLMGTGGHLWKNLLKTLFLYGLAARIPVIIVMGLAIFGDWGTHYDAFPPNFPPVSQFVGFLLGAVVTQLVVWVAIWTVGTGMLTGWIASKFMASRTASD